ncbi:Dps DNA-binding ferritin-like protein (oxidative damage protectant) [uncultured Caudovirales phage]|uniref:Dps DNA-binding ferritin-like protein (Oxidative damage protectant) n=1 Tax=uncultured Caudovirales phage TaxID=2100421 RepID=A0A6J5PSE2_9CAUD|nr:Dps DNA-binding ferritin-like protein (oxidative damage protectant) [uncultured Caudovirales phage]CAB4185734.1 Dps DNA-binding ferritin-like protein (oxidative damage protectant) [uncultured Caudovirales phage]CAB4193081.1 Dps DNA-binding ferritin-like protein (oxidative damage protectant) [uncultured Caudovirales phage]CAB4216230.1 Dps DNA-binding ferritin-like protein (oxidative damage protectant) [uncultured Caudovirales phage]CAB5230856.1 Dps DNA-binding ferritin-like protein (oxidative
MLADNLKTLLATSVSLYVKAANFHWNIEGPNFPQYHEFLGDFYGEIYATIDTIAEYIRALDQYAPASLSRFAELTLIPDQTQQLSWDQMFTELLRDSNTTLDFLNTSFKVATNEDQQGIANFLAERIDAMQKHNWMMRSILKMSKA